MVEKKCHHLSLIPLKVSVLSILGSDDLGNLILKDSLGTPPPSGYRIQDIDWLGLSASVLAGEGFPQPGPERPK